VADIREAKVPDIGDYKGVPVIEVLVAAGDRVSLDQGLLTLESDKATMEVPAPFAGTVREVKVKVGDEVAEGTVVAMIEADDGAQSQAADEDASKTAAAKPSEEPAAAAKNAPDKDKSDPPTPSPGKSDTNQPATDMPKAERTESSNAKAPVAASRSSDDHSTPPHASPGVRRYARELGVDLSRVSGSGRKQRITREDVNSFVKSSLAQPASAGRSAASSGLQLLPWPKVDFSKFGSVETKPLSRIKKISGANLARNWAMIPHVTHQEEADITEMEAFRKQVGSEQKDLKVTPLVFLIKAVVKALQRFPSFNASLDETAENLVLKHYFHVGIAVDTPDGLVVPVLRDCDRKSLLDLARELGEVSARARDKKLKPDEMQGGSMSISSLGGIGGSSFTPIINAPEVAILGVCKASMKPIWNGSAFEPRLMLPLSLSYDHRVIDGAEAARFASYLAQLLADVRRLLL
jgi:pyruvate dehydrogenase E2 component (dihydrolipoamide acetyltransferase)